MKFIKDLLFFEINTTGPDLDKDSVIQLSAVLLDKDNLLEKDFFNSYIRISYLDSLLLAHSKLLNIEYEQMKKSPKPAEAFKNFHNKFNSSQILLAAHGTNNLLFLKAAFWRFPILRSSFFLFRFRPHLSRSHHAFPGFGLGAQFRRAKTDSRSSGQRERKMDFCGQRRLF